MTTTTELPPSAEGDALPEKELNAEEFESWAFKQELLRCEWVEGRIIVMALVTNWHNDLNRWLIVLFSHFVDERDRE